MVKPQQRKTKQRHAIREAIAHAGRPLSVHEILKIASHDQPGLGIATIYRTIKSLIAEGSIHEVALAGADVRFELSDLHHHHHFHCRRCDKVFEMEGCPENLRLLTPKGFRMESHDLVITGLCAGCLRKQTDQARSG
jgi:Fur family ferric uptake transcriptional regulator